MNGRLSRISMLSVMTSASTVLAGAVVVMLSGHLAFADGGAPVQIDRDADLPIDAPVLKMPVPKAPEAPNPPTVVDSTPPPVFFGKDIENTGSIVYVIDQSGSMSLTVSPFTNNDGKKVTGGNRMDRAKSELTKSILSLPSSFVFNVVFYDECVRTWKGSAVKASDSNKNEAFKYISAQEPMGFTNTGLGVATALQDKGNKTVVLLSDGEPNFLDCACNYVGTYDEHKNLIRSANSQNARIDCFGIGVSGDPDAKNFMMQVAAMNQGTYVEIN
jgi:hypothetical protein